jgi:hypothetical protein
MAGTDRLLLKKCIDSNAPRLSCVQATVTGDTCPSAIQIGGHFYAASRAWFTEHDSQGLSAGSAYAPFANAMNDLRQATTKGGMLYVFGLP